MDQKQVDYNGLTSALATLDLHHVLLFNNDQSVRVEFEGGIVIEVDWVRHWFGFPNYMATAERIAQIMFEQ